MIVVDNAVAKTKLALPARAVSMVRRASFTWERGVLAIVGTAADGTVALLDALAGRVPLDAGRITIGGHPPRTHALRRIVAHVPYEASLPDALRVDEVCALARTIRGDAATPADSVLAPLGLSALATRRVRSLSSAESRAVLLAITLASSAPVLLIDEPLAGLDPAAPSKVIAAIRVRAAAGATIVITTASVRDATRLADQLGLLTHGVFSHLPPALAHVGTGGAKLRVVVRASQPSEASPFVAALTAEGAVATIESVVSSPTPIRAGHVAISVVGPDLLALARAVAAAAAASSAAIETIESAVLPIDAIRAALASPRGPLLPSVPPAPPPAAPPPPPAPPPAEGAP